MTTTESKRKEGQADIRSLVVILFQYRWIALASFLVILGVGWLLTFSTNPVYETESQVYLNIDPERLTLVRKGELGPRETLDHVVATEAGVIKSWIVIEQALEKCGLKRGDDPAYSLERIQEDLQVEQVKSASILEIRIRHTDAAFAQEFLNALVEAYIEVGSSTEQLNENIQYYQKQVGENEEEMRNLELELDAYKQSHSIVMISEQMESELAFNDELRSRLYALESDEAQESAKLTRMEQLLDQFDPALLPPATVQENVQLREMLHQYNQLLSDRIRLLVNYVPESDEVSSLNTEIGELARELESVYKPMVVHQRHQLDLIRTELVQVRQNMAETRRRLEEFTQAENNYNNLRRQLDDRNQLRSLLFNKLEETKLNTINTGKVRPEQLAPARQPSKPVKPNVPFNMTLSLVLALMISVSLPYYLHLTNDRISSQYDAERYTGLKVLGIVPLAKE